ncbi:CLUMA_CG021458, isoform A [Clunio marinus]|uniref:CLUMA_CG021458, isoform A n=1 Tax=Clunio marinus TaxID=568069 RepID=A0A1J1J7B7_9DIPT|nr:CLUMA_CG021458, isoform A [Clunio marinus]
MSCNKARQFSGFNVERAKSGTKLTGKLRSAIEASMEIIKIFTSHLMHGDNQNIYITSYVLLTNIQTIPLHTLALYCL